MVTEDKIAKAIQFQIQFLTNELDEYNTKLN